MPLNDEAERREPQLASGSELAVTPAALAKLFAGAEPPQDPGRFEILTAVPGGYFALDDAAHPTLIVPSQRDAFWLGETWAD